jgi:hypothetical protein
MDVLEVASPSRTPLQPWVNTSGFLTMTSFDVYMITASPKMTVPWPLHFLETDG